ncbi:MAG: helix-turn-helix transcriptional regulator [Candidatus Melainabacteria bacterium]|nr:helix-turn-helix transcriptional regulator [Candidatus Melainabacteria bacterium]
MNAMKLSNEYLALIRRFPLVPIRGNQQLHEAITLMKELSTPGRLATLTNSEGDYLDVLADLILKYEKVHWKSLAATMTPSQTLNYLLDQSNISQSELARQTGTRQSHISEFLAGKRNLSQANIVRIAHFFNVSPSAFLSGTIEE